MHNLSSFSRSSSSNPVVLLQPSPSLPLLYAARRSGQLEVWDLRSVRTELRKTLQLKAMGVAGITGGDVDGDEGEWVLQGTGGEVNVVSWMRWKTPLRVDERRSREVWNEEEVGGRRAVWVQGQQSAQLGGLHRRRVAVVAHAMSGAQLCFSAVPLDGDEHSEAEWQERPANPHGEAAAELPSPEQQAAEQIPVVAPSGSSRVMQAEEEDEEEEEEEERVQSSLTRFFRSAPAAPSREAREERKPSVAERQSRMTRRRAWCQCCAKTVARVTLHTAVTVLESHPTCGYVVCGLANNEVQVVGPMNVQDEAEDGDVRSTAPSSTALR